MNEKLWRIGTTYIPVSDIELSANWYVEKLGARVNYQDDDKCILDLANQSIFLVRSPSGQNANFIDLAGEEHFSITFEVDGVKSLEFLRLELAVDDVRVGELEDRGHAGRNFVFYDPDGNKFDVWSELSPRFKEKYRLLEG
ncbi:MULTISPECIES: VOC family protein [Oceanobacillus]|uniref:VOC family protein n=1 Tax=Oceanobacillus TaxID=182709 RepID=UPI00034AB956|nr:MULTISPECIES: VOC family protein [Oceanobacillus]MBT2653124.1 VOC family protein [Oceanobacillus sp. ISL-73]MCT1577728.1 VOC family protein [Oceanobacillus kimchii]MCT2136716.1 VOC family protein [Oceanobacillus kimchii]OEH53850.1 glyoxalase [Oceanobacillus sp. E9]